MYVHARTYLCEDEMQLRWCQRFVHHAAIKDPTLLAQLVQRRAGHARRIARVAVQSGVCVNVPNGLLNVYCDR